MDQIQRDKIAAKLKKIKALAERGVGGEKETAMRMYEDLKARYELEDEEIMLDAVTLHWFGYADELEAFLVAFRWGNDLFPDETARCYKEDDAEAPERTDEEKRMLKKAAWYSNLMDKRKPPTALLGEPEEED